jgi:hypothetical protein
MTPDLNPALRPLKQNMDDYQSEIYNLNSEMIF